jgi:uncharacterized protein
MRMHRRSFTVAITLISRLILLRDRVLGRIGSGRCEDTSDALASRVSIASGSNVLDAVFVKPASCPVRSVVLICHGIGEVVEHWFPVQQLLAANGVASLVFDYSGYGKSTGFVSARQCEDDAISAFRHLETLIPSYPIAVLGFSLGSGIAAAVVTRVPADRLILCAGFTSFREAARSVGIPKSLGALVPPIWSAQEALRDCTVPVLIVHGEEDRLFPVEMAEALMACCGADSELILVPKLGHNQPYDRPELWYWELILSRLTREPGSTG